MARKDVKMANEDTYSEDEEKPEDQEMSEEEKKDLEMDTNEEDIDIYEDEGSEKLEEEDIIDPDEEGFMKGAAGDGEDAKCRECGDILVEDHIEKEIDGEIMRFCSEGCLEKYEKRHDEEEE